MLAAAFDADRLALTGPPIRVVESLAIEATGGPIAGMSQTGVLVYGSTGQVTSQVVWVSRQGVEQSVSNAARHYQNPRLAPDGRQLVVTANGDLWMQDMVRGTLTRLTTNDTVGNSFPTWTPDGKRVVFRTQAGLRWIDAEGSGRSEAIAGTTVNDYPGSVSPDGNTLAFTRISGDSSADVYALSLRGEPQPHEGSHAIALSPDGRRTPRSPVAAAMLRQPGQSGDGDVVRSRGETAALEPNGRLYLTR